MKTAQELYQEKKMSAEQVLDHIQSKDFIVCAQAAAEPAALLQKMEYLKTTGVQDVLFSSCVPAQDYSFFHPAGSPPDRCVFVKLSGFSLHLMTYLFYCE